MGKYIKNNSTDHLLDSTGKKTRCGLRVDTLSFVVTEERFIQNLNKPKWCCKTCAKTLKNDPKTSTEIK